MPPLFTILLGEQARYILKTIHASSVHNLAWGAGTPHPVNYLCLLCSQSCLGSRLATSCKLFMPPLFIILLGEQARYILKTIHASSVHNLAWWAGSLHPEDYSCLLCSQSCLGSRNATSCKLFMPPLFIILLGEQARYILKTIHASSVHNLAWGAGTLHPVNYLCLLCS